jgi:hypothetical protein
MTSTRRDLPAEVVDGHLAELNARSSAGDANALFRAIAFCGNQQIAMPEWVVAGFFAAMNRWWSLHCKTLDEAFGVRWPKGARLGAARKKRALEFAVWNDVTNQHDQGRPINRDLFVEIGKAHGIGKTLAQEYYRSAAQKEAALSPPTLNALLEAFMTPAAKLPRASRKVTKLRGTRSKPR